LAVKALDRLAKIDFGRDPKPAPSAAAAALARAAPLSPTMSSEGPVE